MTREAYRLVLSCPRPDRVSGAGAKALRATRRPTTRRGFAARTLACRDLTTATRPSYETALPERISVTPTFNGGRSGQGAYLRYQPEMEYRHVIPGHR